MKKDDILDAISGIKDEYINEAVPGAARRKSSVWTKAGVIAACLCLFAAVGFLIPYGMNKPTPTPPVDTATIGSDTETTAPATNETTGILEDSIDTGDVQNTPGIGGSDGCHLHHVSYHSIPGGLIDYVIENKGYSEAEVYEWLGSFTIDKTKAESTTECCDPLNIKLFIEKYGITKEEIYDNYSLLLDTPLNVELLYSEDETEIEKYFTDIYELNKNNVREAHYRKVRNLIGAKYEKELESLNIVYNGYSIPELVEVLSIDREDLEGYIKTATDFYIENDGKCYTFDYNLDMLYGGENLEDLSTNHINEMFCRIGRYVDNDFDFIENPDDTDVEENTPAIGGGDYPCKIHDTNYHMLPSELTAFVGGMEVIEAKFNKDTVGEMSCPMLSIKQVIDGFDISVDEFAETIRLVSYPIYDIDILFNGTLAEADEFYTNIDWVLSRGSLSTCYMDLYSEIEAKYPDGVKEIDGGIRLLSIPEVVKLLDIKREDLEEMIKKASDDGSKVTYNYNLDMLYGSDGEIIFEKPDDVSTYELDEMFCRVGRHAE